MRKSTMDRFSQSENFQFSIFNFQTARNWKKSWPQTAEQIYNQIRALNPEPGTWTTWNGRILNILNAEPPYKVRPCRVCRSNDLDYLLPGKIQIVNNQVAIQTSKCYLVIKSLQLEGGKEMDAKSFLRGHPDFASSRLE